MYKVENNTITISRGDTGALRIIAETEHTFTSIDRALFSIKNAVGDIVKQSVHELDENKSFIVTFYNSDTDNLTQGNYYWDVRYVIHPYYDSTGKIINGDQVLTPMTPQSMQILEVVGDV